ncbi:MAG: nucleotidyltransferase domain-containing protein [Bacteroidota bacterium]|nr:nucleotidyltransferase domain-containing protein [Bacteroidota bacterium]
MNKIKDILINTNAQRVINILLDYPREEFLEKEIQRKLRISKSGTNYALKELVGAGLLIKNNRGKQNHWSLNFHNPIVKQMKVILLLNALFDKLKKVSKSIILFGSSSHGGDVNDSDIDLFIISHNREEIERLVKNHKSERKIQAIIRTDLQFIEMKHTDPVFYDQVEHGIVIWEEKSE